jgi:Zn-dependent protease with chaperone function
MNPEIPREPTPQIDPQAQARAADRRHMLAAGLLALPNLFLRSLLTLTLLYGLLGLLLLTIVQFGYLGPGLAVGIGCAVVLLQYILGPWIMDLCLRFLYRMRWVEPQDLPEHLELFVDRVCRQQKMRFPAFCIIDDGAPQAFTYGHHPSNARVVISRGLMEMLTEAEVEGVVAHELGHARNWDMALMTLANLVPLLAYFLYRVAIEISDKNEKAQTPSWVVALGAYVVYIVSEYIVLWFSRTREYNADRFAGTVTENPNALASALVKIAYGLAAQDSQKEQQAAEDAKAKKAKKTPAMAGAGALGALNIFDRKSAVNLVMCASSTGRGAAGTAEVDPERVKSAMQWDLWNPWAKFYELNSTHPLVAKRLLYLSDQAATMGQEPYMTFDRAKPQSYWGGFFVDLGVLALPYAGLIAGLAVFVLTGVTTGAWQLGWLGLALTLLFLGALVRTRCVYRGRLFEHRTVATLMGHVQVSPVRPVPATVTGTIIGKGVPGLIWSEDFVIRDSTGILFLDYRQPLAIWSWLFGLLRAERYQGKEVRVQGWFRRGPTPYLEIYHMDVVDGSEPSRTCYAYHASMFVSGLLALLAAAATAWLFVAGV